MFKNIVVSEIQKVIFSIPVKESKYIKANAKKIIIKDVECFQLALYTKTQVFHENMNEVEFEVKMTKLMETGFKQVEVYTKEYIYGYKISSKGKVLSNRRINTEEIKITTHNKEKNYILKEGIVVPPLVDLGIMTESGKVVKSYYDKYKQINKFLEIIDDTVKSDEKINIIDFGCGKSYLTFILYYYFSEIRKIDVNITGLDLKKEVIEDCNKISEKYGYTNLSFQLGDISLYKPKDKVDMIITLHACDTATDYALYHAIKLESKYILSVPCCQHEINAQMSKNSFELMNKYGLVKERFSSLLTDSIRANILEYYGYKVNVMEFIDIVHSPKNILIKGILTENKYNENLKKEIIDTLNKFNITQTLYKLCFE